jgi:hypothetical protein
MAEEQGARRVYLDRLGRPITDEKSIEARRLLQNLRRLITKGVKAGAIWTEAVTVGQLAAAVRLTPQRVLDIIREFDSWLWNVTERDGPIESWWVWEDGE